MVIATVVHIYDLKMLTQVTNLHLLFRVLNLTWLLLNHMWFLEWNPCLRKQHLIILLLYGLIQINRILLLYLLFLLLQLSYDIRPILRQSPYEIIVSCQIKTEIQFKILL